MTEKIESFYKIDDITDSERKKPQPLFWIKGFRWGATAAAEFLDVSPDIFKLYADEFGCDAPAHIIVDRQRNCLKVGEVGEQLPDESSHMYLKRISTANNIHIETLRYRFKKGIRGEDLLKKKKKIK